MLTRFCRRRPRCALAPWSTHLWEAASRSAVALSGQVPWTAFRVTQLTLKSILTRGRVFYSVCVTGEEGGCV